MLPIRVGVSKVGGIFVHKSLQERFAEKSTLYIRESTMKESLTPAQEEEAQKLAQTLAKATYDDLLRMARALVASDTASLFGDTEFTVRDLSHAIAAKAYQQHPEQKKRLPRVQHNLPPRRLRRRLSRRPLPHPGRPLWRHPLLSRLLLLPTLLRRLLPLR
jgi:hypothetical protein